MTSLLLRNVRIVPVRSPAPATAVDLRIDDGRVRDVAAGLTPEPGERVVDADGRWAIPGLWDQHVHLTQWAQTRIRLDLSGTDDPSEVTARVARHLARDTGSGWVFGFGFRWADWSRRPTVTELDAVSGSRPVVLTSGDAHTGWLNSAALAALGVPHTDDPLTEVPWFELLPRVLELDTAQHGHEPIAQAVSEAAARGVVGVTDFEFADPIANWRERVAHGITAVTVRSAVYPDHLDAVVSAGMRTGDPITDDGVVVLGPLKIISDGSLNTRTAHCRTPYAGTTDRGAQNHDRAELIELLATARRGGLSAAVHAIGDAAAHEALAAFAASGARGSIEHAQLMTDREIADMASLGVTAGVQPSHLLDDRDTAVRLWPDRHQDCFRLRSLLDAGVPLVLGSDAPVAPLDPWVSMAAAVHRSADERPPWNPAEAITVAEALAASIDGQDTIAPGSRADVALLDRDPLAPAPDTATAATRLRTLRVEATLRAGTFTHAVPGLL